MDGINASVRISTEVSNCSAGASPRASFTASWSILQYRSYPTASMWPLCSAPSRFPAPRISRSRMAILNPLPRSEYSRMAASRFSATSLSILFLRYIRNAYAVRLDLPTRPRSWYSWESPILSASWMIMVLTFEISSPVSMIVVDTSTSMSPLINRYMISSSWFSLICPWANATFASGTSSWMRDVTSSISLTLLYT